MVKLSVLSYRGNSNTRAFPHSGYLGLTPVKVEGVIRTTLEEDRKPLLANNIIVSVKCVESRMGRVGVVHSNTLVEYNQILWSKPQGVDWGELGDEELPFKITIPADSPGYSHTNFQDYRIYWRIDAVINHTPIFGVGSRKVKSYEIPLRRYGSSVQRRTLHPHSSSAFLVTKKPRAPIIQYQLTHPFTPVGPLDIVTVHLVLRPLDPSVIIRSTSLVVERRIELNEAAHTARERYTSTNSASPSPLHPSSETEDNSGSTSRNSNHDRNRAHNSQISELPSNPVQLLKVNQMPDTSVLSLNSVYTANSLASAVEQRPLLTPAVADLPAKTISLTVAHVDNSGPFVRDATGTYTKSLTLQWPANKSNSHWAMGETMQTSMINVRFFIHVKIIVSSPISGTETIELEERELLLIATNESERKLAIAKYNDANARSKSKSKSPRRSKPPRSPLSESPENQLPSPSPIPPVPQTAIPRDSLGTFKTSRTSASSSSSNSSHALRRPHTSAGLRDTRSHHRHHAHHCEIEDENPGRFSIKKTTASSTRRPETALSTTPINTKESSLGFGSGTSSPHSSHTHSPASAYPYPNVHVRRGSCETAGGATSPSDPRTVQAWEEELKRIERTSHRVSVNMLGFNLKRFRPRSARPKTAATLST